MMAQFRIHQDKNFTVLSNEMLREQQMSLKAKGLLAVMLSLPPDWNYSINGLVAICKENLTAVKTALRELKENGYLTIMKCSPTKETHGKITYIYDVYANKKQNPDFQQIEKQGVEIQGVDFLHIENHTQLNIDIQRKEELKKDNKKDIPALENAESDKYLISDIVQSYNDICYSLPKVKALTDKRKRAIKARCKNYDLVEFTKVFEKAQASDFLSGRSGSWSGANFDWLINENNMVKVLEGNYDNKKQHNPHSATKDYTGGWE